MRITNVRNLPDFFVRATDAYQRIGDVSATGLLDPIQKTIIVRRFWNDIEEDAASRLWAIFGRAVHSIFEESERADAFKKLSSTMRDAQVAREQGASESQLVHLLDEILKIFHEIPIIEDRVAVQIIGNQVKAIPIDLAIELTDQPHEGLIVSGCADHIDRVRKHIHDIKVTKAYAHKYGTHMPKWREQLSIYKLIYGINGIDIAGASILEMLRDWNEYELERQKDYPDNEVYELPVDLMPDDETYSLIASRGNQILDLLDAPLKDLPPCSDEDRWCDPPSFAVYSKAGAKRATKLFKLERGDDPALAYKAACDLRDEKGGTAFVEERLARNKRCESWCSAAPFCLQWEALQTGTPVEEEA